MANRIILKKSVVHGRIPSPSDMEIGELAVNTFDKKLYTKHTDGLVHAIEAEVSLLSVGTPGTYTKVSTDEKGRVYFGTTLTPEDIPQLEVSKINGLTETLNDQVSLMVAWS